MPLALKASIKIQLCFARQLDAVTVAIAMEQSTSQIIVKLVLKATGLFRGSRIHPTPNKCMTIAKAHRYKANYFFLFAGK